MKEMGESIGLLAHKALPYLEPHLMCITFRQVSHLRLRGLADAAWLGGDRLSQLGVFAVTLLPPHGPGPPTKKGGNDSLREPLP